MADFDLTQSGQEIQNILDGAAMQTDLTAEIERAEQAEQQLQGNIDIEETRAKAAEKQNADDIDVIDGKIPAAASSENQLADKAFVNSSIATATATYRGAYNLVSDLHLTIDATEQQIAAALAGAISTADNNDYCFVQIPTADATPTQIAAIERYKFNGTAWAYEYTLNNSGFTADQWAALNSGITTGLVAKLATLPTNDELTLLLGGKQDVLTFDNVPTDGSNNPVKSGGVKSAIDSEKERAQGAEQANAGNIAQVIAMIPAAASSENQLADKNFVNSSITTNTATYRGAYNEVSDLNLTVDATHEQIAAALAGAISTADNNDYCFVQIPTADATPTQIAAIERYKFNGTAWAYEYTLNNSGFTADQWAAINSGITSGLVAKLAALPTNDDLVAALAGKQPMLTFDNVPTESSTNPVKSGGVYAAIAEEADTRAAAIAAIVALIPSTASALNQLADKAFVDSSISTATAVFKGTFNVVADLELNYNASQAQIALMLGSKIASADNNDYCFVQIPNSNETPLEIARTDRYKFNGTAWAYEYTLNNSGFTAAQWAAINSGITSLLKDKLIDLPTATELATQLAAKQNALTFDTTPTEGSTNPVTSDGIKAAIDAIQGNINTEVARALAAEQGLQDDYDDLYALYQTLEGGSIIPVAAADWPVSNPQQNVIYRVANSATPTAYSDYMYNGTNTLLLATFTFPGIDSEPTPNSTNLVTSGGTFDAIMQNGPAFDLSAYNAVGSTLATYADLSAALTALNTLPAAYKKGGMSMKFVQSSDNKYIQARLMANAFTTDVTQWQSVDDEPTAGSDNLVKSGGIEKALVELDSTSSKQLQKKFEEYENYKKLNPNILSLDGCLYITDKNGNIIALFNANGLEATRFISKDLNKLQAFFNSLNSVLNFYNPEEFNFIDKNYNIICKISQNGIQSTSFLDKDGTPITNKNSLIGKELFVVGDSMSAGGTWEAKVAEITGCTFDQSKNSKPGSQISTGGTISYGCVKDCGLARILNIKKEGYAPDIIILENVNDAQAFNDNGEPISGTINDAPCIINQILEGYNYSDWVSDAAELLSNIPLNQRMFGTSIQLQYTTSGKNMKILTPASNDGDIKIGVNTAQTGWLYYNIHILSSDSISDIIYKILEYNYSMVADTIGSDNESVNFSTGNSTYPCNINFEDIGNTGVTVSITDVDNAKATSPKLFIGENLTTDWINPEKWTSNVSFFSAWKGMIEFAKINFPAAEVVLLMFPVRSMNPSDYINANGTFNQEAYNATLKRTEGMFEYQKKVAEIYSIPIIDIHHNCGVTVGNYNQYYWNNNGHPKENGYGYFGEKIAKALLNIL